MIKILLANIVRKRSIAPLFDDTEMDRKSILVNFLLLSTNPSEFVANSSKFSYSLRFFEKKCIFFKKLEQFVAVLSKLFNFFRCTGCEDGYSGPFCEVINCDHGQINRVGTGCLCDKPWNGTFCSSLSTNNVYSYYNRKVG